MENELIEKCLEPIAQICYDQYRGDLPSKPLRLADGDYQRAMYVRAKGVLEVAIPLISAEARKQERETLLEELDEPCPHRLNDFPCPDNVPQELQMKKSDCPDCLQALKEGGKEAE